MALSFTLSEPRNQAWLFASVVFLSLAFVLPGIAKYHGDECFYTDAAIRMMQTGDYLTPYAADGALRFAKPILPYWSVAIGYWLFGINFFASRIVFLLAGCLVIVLTHRLSLALFNQPHEAVLSAIIIGSNIQLLTISIRSTPDALLTVFVMVSLLGFARLIFRGEKAWKNYFFAYIGAALAVETRGLPGVGVVAFPFLYLLLFRRNVRPQSLLEWKAILVALIVGSAWFIAMFWRHGHDLVEGFYFDQVSSNVEGYSSIDFVKNLAVYLAGICRHFLPWSLLAAMALLVDRQKAASFVRCHRQEAIFLAGWLVFILTAFLFGSFYRTRYMIVAYPSVAILAASFLARYFEVDLFVRTLRRIIGVLAIPLLALGACCIGLGLMVDIRMSWAGVLLLAAAGMTFYAFRRPSTGMLVLAIAVLPLSGFLVTEVFLRPVFSQSPAQKIALRLLAAPGMTKAYALNLSPSIQAQIRVYAKGRINLVPLRAKAGQPLPQDAPIVLAASDRNLFPERAKVLEEAAYASNRWRGKDFLALLDASKRAATFARNRTPYFICWN